VIHAKNDCSVTYYPPSLLCRPSRGLCFGDSHVFLLRVALPVKSDLNKQDLWGWSDWGNLIGRYVRGPHGPYTS
jgi:hypothetical protein